MVALFTAANLMLACNSGPALTADQERGKRIYETLCDKCHKLIPPLAHTDPEWNLATDKYGIKLKLQPSEVALLRAYLNRANDADFKQE